MNGEINKERLRVYSKKSDASANTVFTELANALGLPEDFEEEDSGRQPLRG